MAERALAAGATESFSHALRRDERAKRHAISWPSARTTRPRSAIASNWRATNARAVRTALTAEMWEAINGAWLELRRYERRRAQPRGVRPLPRLGERHLAGLRRLGLPDDAAQRRLLVHRLGTVIERADNTARILDVKYHLLLPATERSAAPRLLPVDRRSCARFRRSRPTIGSTARAQAAGSWPTS